MPRIDAVLAGKAKADALYDDDRIIISSGGETKYILKADLPSGTSGTGTPGIDGRSGYSGMIGNRGFSGYSGLSGYSGSRGYSGYSGYSGKSVVVFASDTEPALGDVPIDGFWLDTSTMIVNIGSGDSTSTFTITFEGGGSTSTYSQIADGGNA